MNLADLAQVATAGAFVVSLVLLWQGQRDRREIRRVREEEQARRVTLGVEQHQRQTGPHSSETLGCTLHVRNDSDRQVQIGALTLVWSDAWETVRERGEFQLCIEPVELGRSFLRPTEGLNLHFDQRWIGDSVSGGDFAVLHIVDESGGRWRRRSDTGELQRWPSPPGKFPRAFQSVARTLPPVHWLLIHWPARLAFRRVRRRGASMVPLSARWVVALWGYWPAGERDPWLRPQGAPALWGYDTLELYGLGLLPA
jgi:hypothetical protein